MECVVCNIEQEILQICVIFPWLFNIKMGKCLKSAYGNIKKYMDWVWSGIYFYADSVMRTWVIHTVWCKREYGTENWYIKDQSSFSWQSKWNEQL